MYDLWGINMAIDYTDASKTYDNTRSSDDEIIEIMSRNGVFSENTNVLDFGCGTGNYLCKISQKYKCTCYGIEPSSGMREIACRKNPNLKIVEGDHEKMVFENKFFDFIYMTDVIHHIKNINLLLKNLSAKLKVEGKICIKTQSWKQIENRWYNRYFSSLETKEKERYPDIEEIIETARLYNLILQKIDIKKWPLENKVDEYFIKNVEEKNYSMFRLIGEKEFKDGLAKLKNDIGKVIIAKDSEESLIWLNKATHCA
jgi:ubiquinone/menaquinone biosynthesis C-methylase UbiE